MRHSSHTADNLVLYKTLPAIEHKAKQFSKWPPTPPNTHTHACTHSQSDIQIHSITSTSTVHDSHTSTHSQSDIQIHFITSTSTVHDSHTCTHSQSDIQIHSITSTSTVHDSHTNSPCVWECLSTPLKVKCHYYSLNHFWMKNSWSVTCGCCWNHPVSVHSQVFFPDLHQVVQTNSGQKNVPFQEV